MSTHPRPATDRTATDRPTTRTAEGSTPALTDDKWRDERRDPDPFDLDAPVQFSPFHRRRLRNLVDERNLAMLRTTDDRDGDGSERGGRPTAARPASD